MRFRNSLCCFLSLLFIAACASEGPVVEAPAATSPNLEVSLRKSFVSTLIQACQDLDPGKEQVVRGVPCTNTGCKIPLSSRSLASEGASKEIALDSASLAGLIQVMDRADLAGIRQTYQQDGAKLSCSPEGCSILFKEEEMSQPDRLEPTLTQLIRGAVQASE